MTLGDKVVRDDSFGALADGGGVRARGGFNRGSIGVLMCALLMGECADWLE